MTDRRTFLGTLAVAACGRFLGAAEPAREWFDGRPVFGDDLGYFVWREGDKWRVRWTSAGRQHSFTGSVEAEGGKLRSLDKVDVEKEKRVVAPARPGDTWVGPRGRVHHRPGRGPVVATREVDRIEKEEGDFRIVWTSKAAADLDGFDFEVEDKVAALHFLLQVDGQKRPRAVHVGGAGKEPATVPFTIRLK